MTQKRFASGLRAIFTLLAVAVIASPALAADDGFEMLFDGKSMDGWKANENADSWKLVDGEIVCRGDRSHLFYVGKDPNKPAEFKNFHFKAEVMTKPGTTLASSFTPSGKMRAGQPRATRCRSTTRRVIPSVPGAFTTS